MNFYTVREGFLKVFSGLRQFGSQVFDKRAHKLDGKSDNAQVTDVCGLDISQYTVRMHCTWGLQFHLR